MTIILACLGLCVAILSGKTINGGHAIGIVLVLMSIACAIDMRSQS